MAITQVVPSWWSVSSPLAGWEQGDGKSSWTCCLCSLEGLPHPPLPDFFSFPRVEQGTLHCLCHIPPWPHLRWTLGRMLLSGESGQSIIRTVLGAAGIGTRNLSREVKYSEAINDQTPNSFIKNLLEWKRERKKQRKKREREKAGKKGKASTGWTVFSTNSRVKILTPRTSEHDCIWRQGLWRAIKVKWGQMHQS